MAVLANYRTQPRLVPAPNHAPRYCLMASAGFGQQFAKLHALSRLWRRYDARKYRIPFVPCSLKLRSFAKNIFLSPLTILAKRI